MKNIVKIITFTLVMTIVTPVTATDSPTNIFAGCMVDHLNGKERKNLARWIFLSMSVHPVIKPYSSATSNDLKESDQYIGKLITRLLTVDCPKEFKVATKFDSQAIEKAFELIGEIAMQEIMRNKETKKQ